jgi:hypothetical protein
VRALGTLLLVLSLSGWASSAELTDAAAAPSAEAAPGWVLQLGYFAHLDKALALKADMTAAGFAAQVVATGLPGDRRYQVISGRVNDPADLEALQADIERRTGYEAMVVKDPFATDKVREVFDQPRLKYLLAQAGSELPLNPSPQATVGYDAGLHRTPQEEIDSMPGFTAAGLQVVPTIGLSLGYDDNITRASFSEISSWFYMISPAIRAELPSDRSVLGVTLGADFVRYQDSPIDDRDYWYLRGEWTWDVSPRQNLDLFAQYAEGADQRGEGRRQGDAGLIPLPPDEWQSTGFGGSWDYGAVAARGRLTLRGGLSELEYTNNRDDFVTGGTRQLDRDWYYLGGTFYWRVAPKTSVLADYQYTDMNYQEDFQQDSEMHSWMLGVTWDATARTTGRISYGDQKRSFDDPTAEDYSGPVWMASVSWRPRTYSVFTLTGSRSTQEPNGNGDYVLRQDITLSWLHDWAPRFGTNVDIGYGEDEYRPDGRQDELIYWGVGARYAFNQHFRFGASITGYDRTSDEPEFEYDRLVYLLTLEASF